MGKASRAESLIEETTELLWGGGGPYPYVFSGLLYLSRAQQEKPEDLQRWRQRVKIRWTYYWEVYWDFKRRSEYDEEATEPRYDEYSAFWTPLQLALAYLAIGNIEWAIGLLERAMSEGDPLTVWLHLVPLFDPLRSEPGFQSLIKRMKLPAAK
jgi:hypothetical protein